MSKKPVSMEGMFNSGKSPAATGIEQRGGEPHAEPAQPSKRLSVAVSGEDYRRLRLHAVNSGQSHQQILTAALTHYLDSVSE